MRLHVPVDGAGCEISWAKEQRKQLAGPAEPATTHTELTGGAAESSSDATMPPAPEESSRARRELDFARPQNRFHQMVQEMERKYATARPLQRSKRKPDGKTAGSKAKVARGNPGSDEPLAPGLQLLQQRRETTATNGCAPAGEAAAAPSASGAAGTSGGEAGEAAASGSARDAEAVAGPSASGTAPAGHEAVAAEGHNGANGAAASSGTAEARGSEANGATQGEGESEEEEEEEEGEEEGSEAGSGAESDDGSWYVSDDGFIDDTEILEEMGDDDEGGLEGDAPPPLKASGFFISRGEVQSAEQIAEQARREAEREAERLQQHRRKPQAPTRADATDAARVDRAFGVNPWSLAAGAAGAVGGAAGSPRPAERGGAGGRGGKGGGGGAGGRASAAGTPRASAASTPPRHPSQASPHRAAGAASAVAATAAAQAGAAAAAQARAQAQAAAGAAAAASGAPLTQRVEIVVPPGVLPGQQLRVRAPDGLSVALVLPPGVAPGQRLQVQVPASAAAPAGAPAATGAPAAAAAAAATATGGAGAAAAEKAAAKAAKAAAALQVPVVSAAQAAAAVQQSAAMVTAALHALRQAVLADPKLAPLLAEHTPSLSGAAPSSQKGLKLSPALTPPLVAVCRAAIYRAHAEAAQRGAPLQLTPSDGAPQPSVWLRRELLAQLLTMLPLAENSIRSRLIAIGKQAALPELLVLLRRGLDERLEALQTKLAEALAPQRAAYDETAQAAEARINQLRRLPAEEPAKLVGEELEVHRVPEGASAGKFAPAKVVAAPGAREGQTFTVVYKDDEAKRVKVDLATAKWRPAGGVAPPRFEWHESTDAALLAACERQLLLQDKEREWAQLRAKLLALAPALAPALQTSGAEPPAEERIADKEKDKEAAEAGGTGHPEFKALLSRVQKCFPAKWMTAAKLATRLKQLKEAARKEASAKKEAELAAKKEAAATAAAKREGLQAAAQAADTQAAAAGQLPEAVEAAAQQAVAAAAAASGPAAPDTSWMATPAAAGADVAPTAAAPEEV